MLDVQRIKFEIVNQLKAQGMRSEEIKARLHQDMRPFQPAFVNGKRRVELATTQAI